MNHLQSLYRILNEADVRLANLSLQSNVVQEGERGLVLEITTLTGMKVRHWFKGTDEPQSVAEEILTKINQ